MHRIAIFCDVRNPAARALLRGLMRALAARNDARVVAVCPFGSHSLFSQFLAWLGPGVVRKFQRAIDRELPRHRWGAAPIALGTRVGARVIKADWTAPGVASLCQALAALEPSDAINLYTPRRFPPELLRMFRSALNYHNGELPRYRGLRATHWSVYQRESTSGWAVHHMTEALDRGNVLASGAVPIGDRDGIAELEQAKAEQALADIPALLERWFQGDAGIPQTGVGRLFTRADYARITHVDFPERLDAQEWLWRIRCFSRVWARVAGNPIPVTRLVPVAGLRHGVIGWRCADGECLRVLRADFLPVGLYRITRRLTGGRKSGSGHAQDVEKRGLG